MKTASSKIESPHVQGKEYRPILGEYYPLETLWAEDAPNPIFASEGAARWFLRNNKIALAEAKATAIHTGRILIHTVRFAAVAESVALRNAASRAGCDVQA
jgi:hypothetical protein